MEDFSSIYSATKLKKTIENSTIKIASEIKKIDDDIKEIQREFNLAISLGKNRDQQNRTYVATILKIAAAPLCFVPIVGPVAGTATASLAGFIQKGFFNLEGLSSIVTDLSTRGLDRAKGDNDNPLQVLIGGGKDSQGNALDPARMASASRFVWLYSSSAESSINLIHGLRVGEFKVALENVNKLDLEQEIENYQSFIERSVKKTVKLMSQDDNKHLYLPLLFSNMCQDLGVAGQGSAMLQSLDLRTGHSRKEWVGVYEAKRLLEGKPFRGKALSKFSKARGSKLVALAQERFDGTNDYRNIFKVEKNPDQENTERLDQMITPIYLEKLRLCAYRSRYSEALKSITTTNFLTITNHYESKNQDERFFNKYFYGGRHNIRININDCVSSRGGITKKGIHSHSQFRRRIIYSWYCFHQILKAHLGTYILSSLPTLGINAYLDRRVMFALIDAVSTAWWVTTRAYESQRIVSDLSRDLKKFEITVEQLLQLPYIAEYFKPQNILYNKLVYDAQDIAEANVMTRLKESYDNLLSDETGLVNIDFERLMPRCNSINIGLLRNGYTRKFIESIYGDFRNLINSGKTKFNVFGYENSVYQNVSKFRQEQEAATSYSKDFTERYNSIKDINATAQQLQERYTKLVYGSSANALVNPDISIDREFINNLVNAHMGAVVNAQNIDEFSQLEFNQSMVRAIKSMAKFAGNIQRSVASIISSQASTGVGSVLGSSTAVAVKSSVGNEDYIKQEIGDLTIDEQELVSLDRRDKRKIYSNMVEIKAAFVKSGMYNDADAVAAIKSIQSINKADYKITKAGFVDKMFLNIAIAKLACICSNETIKSYHVYGIDQLQEASCLNTFNISNKLLLVPIYVTGHFTLLIIDNRKNGGKKAYYFDSYNTFEENKLVAKGLEKVKDAVKVNQVMAVLRSTYNYKIQYFTEGFQRNNDCAFLVFDFIGMIYKRGAMTITNKYQEVKTNYLVEKESEINEISKNLRETVCHFVGSPFYTQFDSVSHNSQVKSDQDKNATGVDSYQDQLSDNHPTKVAQNLVTVATS